MILVFYRNCVLLSSFCHYKLIKNGIRNSRILNSNLNFYLFIVIERTLGEPDWAWFLQCYCDEEHKCLPILHVVWLYRKDKDLKYISHISSAFIFIFRELTVDLRLNLALWDSV